MLAIKKESIYLSRAINTAKIPDVNAPLIAMNTPAYGIPIQASLLHGKHCADDSYLTHAVNISNTTFPNGRSEALGYNYLTSLKSSH